MTNETNYRTKANAVFFAAAIMVMVPWLPSALRLLRLLLSRLSTTEMSMIWIRQLANSHRAVTFTLENGTDYNGSASGTAEVDIDVTTADSALTVTSATLDSLSGSNAGDVTSSGSNGPSVSGNVATLTIDESTLGT